MNNFYGEKSFIRLQKEHGFIFVKQYGSRRYLCGYLKKIFDGICAYVMVHGSKYHNNISFVKLYIMTMQRLDDAVENDKSAFKELIGDFENFNSTEKKADDFLNLCEEKIISLIPGFHKIGHEVKNRFYNFSYPDCQRHAVLKYEADVYQIVKDNILLFEDVGIEIKKCIKNDKKLDKSLEIMYGKIKCLKKILPKEYLKHFYFENKQNEESLLGEILVRLYIEFLFE